MLTTAACGSDSTNVQPVSAPTITEPSIQKVVKSGRPIEPVEVADLWVRRDGDRIWADPRPPRDVTRPAQIEALDGLLQWPVPSLSEGTIAVAGGADGATVFPLMRIAASTDDGGSWTTYDVPEVDGERRATIGHALVSDGRLMVLVGNWTDDRRGRPSDRHHGFFISDADDLGQLTPVHPTFTPPLTPTDEAWPPWMSLNASSEPDAVLWTTTWDDRIYASTDDGRSFQEVPLP